MDPVRDFIERLRTRRQQDEESYGHPPPEPEDWSQDTIQFHLTWKKDRPLEPLPDPQPLFDVRAGIHDRIREYLAQSAPEEFLLVRVPPGTGKTTAAVRVVQEVAEEERVLYAASRHDFYADIMGVDGYERPKWYEWQPIRDGDEEKGIPATCRYAEYLLAWLRRGYPGIEFCKDFCQNDRWIKRCPYRLQKEREEPIIFGMHQHLITGMAISDYGCAVCDEMPLGAFLNRRRIPQSGILVPGAEGKIGELLSTLHTLSQLPNPVYGKRLMMFIGDILGDIYAEIEVTGRQEIPLAPALSSPDRVHEAPYWYIFELLDLLSPEYTCYRNDWTKWISRVRVSKEGILMLLRYKPHEAWGKGGKPLVCLDATGSVGMYERIFGRPAIEYAPRVDRPGRIFQIAGRLNGLKTSFEEGKDPELSQSGETMLDAAELIKDQYEGERVAAVTFKGAEYEFQKRFGLLNVRHYGALRGTNDLESASALIVAGGYCPPMQAVFDLSAALHPERMTPFIDQQEDGTLTTPWSHKEMPYRLRYEDERGVPYRNIAGFWEDEDLGVVLEELRRNELTQAIHRVRPNLKDSDVWILTSIPTGEPLDGIYESLSELPWTPRYEKEERVSRSGKVYDYWSGVRWEHWLALRPYLAEQWDKVEYVTKEDLAEEAGVAASTVASQKWFDALTEFYKDQERQWHKFGIRLGGSTHRTWVLAPVKD